MNSQGGNIVPHSGINSIKETTSTGKITQWTKSLPSVRNCVLIPGAYINLDASAIPAHLRQDGKRGQENPQELSGQLAQPMLQATRISAPTRWKARTDIQGCPLTSRQAVTPVFTCIYAYWHR